MSRYLPLEAGEHSGPCGDVVDEELRDDNFSQNGLPNGETPNFEAPNGEGHVQELIMSSNSATEKAEHLDGPRNPALRRKREIWLAPTMMIASLVLGVVFAGSHHAYYASLNDTVVGSAERQQWPLRFGLALALTKACLVNATTTAYVQCIWWRCRERAVRIGALDAAFAVDRNVLMFFKSRYPFEFRLITILAIVFWCIPLASIITPSTLNIASKSNVTQNEVLVNQPTISFYNHENDGGRYGDYSSPRVSQMFTKLASTGEIGQIEKPGGLQNSTFNVQIRAPITRCNESNEDVRKATAFAVHEAALNQRAFMNISRNDTIFHPQNLTLEIPKGIALEEKGVIGKVGFFTKFADNLYIRNGQQQEIWIAIANPPKDLQRTPKTGREIPIAISTLSAYTAKYYTCRLRNASVNAAISFINNVQSVKTSIVHEEDIRNYDEDFGARASIDRYRSWFDYLYTLLDGFAMVSSITPPGNMKAGIYSEIPLNSTASKGILDTAKDYAAMEDAWIYAIRYPNQPVQNKTLTTLIEELSLNASISIMGLAEFNQKVQTQATQTLWLNKYTYSPQNLLIAYGLSILSCLLAITAGCYAVYINGEGYDTHFSTISRAMQGPDIAALFEKSTLRAEAASSGVRWREDVVAKTRVRLHRSEKGGRFCVEDGDREVEEM